MLLNKRMVLEMKLELCTIMLDGHEHRDQNKKEEKLKK